MSHIKIYLVSTIQHTISDNSLRCLHTPYTPSSVRVKRKMTSPYEAELSLAKSAALKGGEIIRSYSNGNGGGRSANSATVAVKSVCLSVLLLCIALLNFLY